MNRRFAVSFVILVVSLIGVPARGQQAPGAQPSALDQAIAQVRKDAAADINTLITGAMRFSADENAKFWPLYKAFDEKRKPLADERLAIIKDYAKNYTSMTDAKAVELTQRVNALDDKLIAGRRTFLDELAKVFSPKTVARYAQVQRRIDLLTDLIIASEVPLGQ